MDVSRTLMNWRWWVVLLPALVLGVVVVFQFLLYALSTALRWVADGVELLSPLSSACSKFAEPRETP